VCAAQAPLRTGLPAVMPPPKLARDMAVFVDVDGTLLEIDEHGHIPVEFRRTGHGRQADPNRRLCSAHIWPHPDLAAMRNPEASQRYLCEGVDSGGPFPKLCGAVWIIYRLVLPYVF
jgi:hypothetical protein